MYIYIYICLKDKEECGNVEKGRNGAGHPKLLGPSLQSLLWPIQDAWGRMWNKTRIHLVHYALGRKYLVLSITRKKICLITVLSFVQTCKHYRHKGRTRVLVFPLILKETINQGHGLNLNFRSCTDLFFFKEPKQQMFFCSHGQKKMYFHFVRHVNSGS